MATGYKYSIYYDGTGTLRYSNYQNSAIPVTYNGSSKPALTSNKTISCANKIMAGNLIIGGKTLSCANKIMKSDVLVQVTAIDVTAISDDGPTSSTSSITAYWKVSTPSAYTGVRICCKTGSYPTSIDDGNVYTGAGDVYSSSSYIYKHSITGLASSTYYYFLITPYLLIDGSIYAWGTGITFSRKTSAPCSCQSDCYCSCQRDCVCSCQGPANTHNELG